MDKQKKIKELRARLQTLAKTGGFDVSSIEEVTNSLIDQKATDLRNALKDDVTVKALNKISEEISRFKKGMNLDPILETLSKIEQELIDSQILMVKDFESKVDLLKGSVNQVVSNQKDSVSLDAVTSKVDSEIKALRDEFVQRIGVSPVKQKSVQETLDLLGGQIESLNKTLEGSVNAKELDTLRSDLLGRIANIGGGSMNRKISVNGTVMSTKFTDLNLKNGNNVTITKADNATTGQVDITFNAAGGGSGSPGGSDTQVQYNSVGAFAGITGATSDGTTLTLVAPVLGAATATSINKVALTAPASAATLTIANNKTLTVNKTLTLDGTDSTTMTFPSTSATIARTDAGNTFTGHQTVEGVTSTGATGTGKFVFDTSPVLVTPNLGTPTALVGTNITGTASGLTAGNVTTNANLTGVITSVGNATAIASQTGTGTKFVVDTTPTLVTPVLGVATATSINKMAITTPATNSTLAVADGKTFTASNTITLTGTDTVSMNVTNTKLTQIGGVFDGGGSAVVNGSTIYVPCVYAGTITGYTILVDTGTCTVKTWKKATGTAIPTVSDSISTSGVAISSGTAIRSATVSDFTSTTVTANDIFAFNITAISGATTIVFFLEITKS